MDIEQVIQDCWQNAEDHGFHQVGRTFGDACALLHSEVSEAFEAFRDKKSEYYEVDGKPEGPLAELADVVIRCFDTALDNLGASAEKFVGVLEAKMAYNRSRPYLHGGKAL